MEEVILRDLGTIDYGQCWDLQKYLFGRLSEAKAGNLRESRATKDAENASDIVKARQHLLLCEHPAVYTLGKSGDEGNMLVAEEFLKSKGADFYRIDRGGDITFHGPGQLVGYPILDLELLELGLRDYIYAVEEAVIATVAEYGISGTRVEGAAGGWLVDGGPLRKICAVGVRASRFVTMHGFALNANTDLSWFGLINPCGFADRGVTSIARETGEAVDMGRLKSRFAAHFGEILNIKINTEDYANRKALGNQATGRTTEGR